jgi:hypothetical protein
VPHPRTQVASKASDIGGGQHRAQSLISRSAITKSSIVLRTSSIANHTSSLTHHTSKIVYRQSALKRLASPLSLHTILQILSRALFEQVELLQHLTKFNDGMSDSEICNRLLFLNL